MKKILFAFLIITTTAKAQLRIDFGPGFSNRGTAAVELGVSVTNQDYFAQVGYVSHLSRYVNNGTVFNFRSGMLFYLNDKTILVPSVGVFYHLKNSDITSMNTSGVLISQKIYRKVRKNEDVFLNLVIAEQAFFITAGASGVFQPRKKISRFYKTSKF